MKTVRIKEAFTGYPGGKRRDFAIGEEPELPNEFADLIIGKGHAEELTAKAAAKPTAERE